MYHCLYLSLTCLLVGLTPTVLFGQSSDKNAPAPARKIIDERSIDYLDFRALRFHLHNAVEHYNHLNEANVNIARSLKTQVDSLAQLRAQLQAQNAQIQQLKQANRQYEKQGANQKNSLDSVRRQTARLDYERQLITDPRVVRIYKFPVAEVRKTLLDNLAKNDSGFGNESEPATDKLVITRQFNERTEAWWLFDKNTDSLLEVTLRLLEHPFDSQRTIVYADTKLLQKNRSTDKLYEDQSDPEKLTLYRDRTLRLLEGFMRSTSEK
jgi:hypothetical protein